MIRMTGLLVLCVCLLLQSCVGTIKGMLRFYLVLLGALGCSSLLCLRKSMAFYANLIANPAEALFGDSSWMVTGPKAIQAWLLHILSTQG